MDLIWSVKMTARGRQFTDGNVENAGRRFEMARFRNIIAWLLLIAGFAGAIYFGGYVMIVKSIMMACSAFDAGTLTAVLVGKTLLKWIFASIVAGVIILAGFVGFGIVSEYD